MGNGAPDVFGAISSFTGNEDVLIGIGALLGGAVFVTTIVVGCVVILCPCQVNRSKFFRDISFHIASVSCISTIAAYGKVNLALSLVLLGVYALYVTVVISRFGNIADSQGGEIQGVQLTGKLVHSNTLNSTLELTLELTLTLTAIGIQTAFWHQSVAAKLPVPASIASRFGPTHFPPPLTQHMHLRHRNSSSCSVDILNSMSSVSRGSLNPLWWPNLRY